jgi:hypothetical protein
LSVTFSANQFQEFHPIGGVAARGGAAWLCAKESGANRKKLKMAHKVDRITFLSDISNSCG